MHWCDELRPVFEDPEFWSDFLFEEEYGNEYPLLDDRRIDFPVGDGYALTLDLGSCCTFSLGIRTEPGTEPTEIAWDDQAHWHPHALQWDELDQIGRAVALTDRRLPHPGMPLLLLYRFAPICASDDLDVVVPLLRTA